MIWLTLPYHSIFGFGDGRLQRHLRAFFIDPFAAASMLNGLAAERGPSNREDLLDVHKNEICTAN